MSSNSSVRRSISQSYSSIVFTLDVLHFIGGGVDSVEKTTSCGKVITASLVLFDAGPDLLEFVLFDCFRQGCQLGALLHLALDFARLDRNNIDSFLAVHRGAN